MSFRNYVAAAASAELLLNHHYVSLSTEDALRYCQLIYVLLIDLSYYWKAISLRLCGEQSRKLLSFCFFIITTLIIDLIDNENYFFCRAYLLVKPTQIL